MKTLYKLPGHSGSVNETTMHPTEPISMFFGALWHGGCERNVYDICSL